MEWWRERLEVVSELSDGFMAICPAHGGDSLHVTAEGDDGMAVLHCHGAGCAYADILAAVEVQPRVSVTRVAPDDLGPVVKTADFARDKNLPVELLHELGLGERVEYTFADGTAHVRRRGGHSWKNGGTPARHPLWPEPPYSVGETLYITEGESDALTLRAAGFEAYGYTGGAGNNKALTVGHYRDLAALGAATVVICGDADDAGQAWMKVEAEKVLAAGLAVGRLDLTSHYNRHRPFPESVKDMNQLWLTCEDADEFRSLMNQHTRLQEARGAYAVDLDEAMSWAEEDVRWLIPDLIERGNKVVIGAPQKSLKTYFVLALAAAGLTRTPFLGWPDWTPEQPLNALIVEEEGSRSQFARRLQRLFNGLDAKVGGELRIKFRHGFRLTEPTQVDELIAFARRERIDLIVFDPWQRLVPGIDENSNSDTKLPWDELHRITLEYPDCAVVLLMHTRKGDALTFDSLRGASRTAGEVDLGIFLRKQDDFRRDETSYEGSLELVLEGRELPDLGSRENGALEVKYRFDQQAHSFTMKYAGGVTVRRVGRGKEGDANRERVAGALTDEWRSQLEIAVEAHISKDRTRDHLQALEAEGRAAKLEQRGKATLWRRV